MDISIFLAQVFGLYFILAGLAMLFRPSAIQELFVMMSDRSNTLLTGFITLLIGIPLVLLHNIWDGSWRVLITALVWATLFKGLVRIFLPDVVIRLAKTLVTHKRTVRHMVWAILVLGLYLVSVGFGWSTQ